MLSWHHSSILVHLPVAYHETYTASMHESSCIHSLWATCFYIELLYVMPCRRSRWSSPGMPPSGLFHKLGFNGVMSPQFDLGTFASSPSIIKHAQDAWTRVIAIVQMGHMHPILCTITRTLFLKYVHGILLSWASAWKLCRGRSQ